jgi:hypothetical protein
VTRALPITATVLAALTIALVAVTHLFAVAVIGIAITGGLLLAWARIKGSQS